MCSVSLRIPRIASHKPFGITMNKNNTMNSNLVLAEMTSDHMHTYIHTQICMYICIFIDIYMRDY